MMENNKIEIDKKILTGLLNVFLSEMTDKQLLRISVKMKEMNLKLDKLIEAIRKEGK